MSTSATTPIMTAETETIPESSKQRFNKPQSLLRRLTVCATGLCPFKQAEDDTHLWGECTKCGRVAGVVSRAKVRSAMEAEAQTTITADPDGNKSTYWEPLPSELRYLSTVNKLRQGVPPDLQMAWRCREDGRIEWRSVPLHLDWSDDGATP